MALTLKCVCTCVCVYIYISFQKNVIIWPFIKASAVSGRYFVQTSKDNKSPFPGETYIFLFINSNGSNIASEAAVTASVDLLVEEAGGVEAHSLVSFLQQGGLLPLDLQDLGLDIYQGDSQQHWCEVKGRDH